MAKNDFQYGGWNSYTLQCGCGSGIVTVNSPSGSTCNVIRGPRMTCHWIRPNVRHIAILHLVSQSTCHSATVSEILSESDHPRQKKWRTSTVTYGASTSQSSRMTCCSRRCITYRTTWVDDYVELFNDDVQQVVDELSLLITTKYSRSSTSCRDQ